MTAEEYIELAAELQEAQAVIARAVMPKAQVLTRDPVNLDDSQWGGALLSDNDVDAEGAKQIHALVITFAGSDDIGTGTVRAITPTFRYRYRYYYSHDFGTTADNSEARARAALLGLQWKVAETPRLNMPPGVVTRHRQFPFRLRFRRLGTSIIHYGEAEIAVEMEPLTTR